MKRNCSLAFCLVAALAVSAHAYVGPGVGVTLIGWFAGCFLATAAALWAVVAWPVRRFLARRRLQRRAIEGKNIPHGPADAP
jgi:hypothetical protein